MSKLVLNNITSGYASIGALNDNFARIETALVNTVSRDGTIPNTMSADLDMNGRSILNISTWSAKTLSADNLYIAGALVTPSSLATSVLPAQPGHLGKYLTTDGNSASWSDGVVTDAELAASSGSSLVGFTQAGTGAVAGTVQTKLREFVSVRDFGAVGDGVTDDTAEVQAAVTHCYSSGDLLYWPDGTYLTTASIANFHDVLHFGSGVVKRGADLFYVKPTSAQTNRIYLSATGSDANDGLSASEPKTTLQNAFDVLKAHGPILNGTWRVVLAAGTYSGNATFPENVRGKERVVIEGPAVNHPNVPTAILSGGDTEAFALNFNGNNKVSISNIKAQNFTTYGIVAQDFCDISTVNFHAAFVTAGDGIKVQQSRLHVNGGIIESCRQGVVVIGLTVFTVGSGASSLATGPVIKNCTVAGMLVQENSSGHADYVTIDNCAVGLDIVVNSRVHSMNSDIKNNATAGVRARQSSSWLNNGTTFSGNTNNELLYSYSGEINTTGNDVTQHRSVIDTTAVAHTGTISETTLKTYSPGVKADSFTWNGRSLRVVITGQFSGASGTKTLRVKVGGNLVHGLTSVASSTGFFKYEGVVYATGTASQRYHAFMIDSSATGVRGDSGTRAINMVTGSDMAITISGELSISTETINIHGVEIWETA